MSNLLFQFRQRHTYRRFRKEEALGGGRQRVVLSDGGKHLELFERDMTGHRIMFSKSEREFSIIR
ncbi:hypothetical protein VspSTUT11_05960 [Vibrio sp. STUT-A11]|nr:hypothetical protein VspSTUT11_05960 [Vibrio sp. STUT-A11]